MAEVVSINISEVRGIQKHEVPEAYFKADWGIEGDAHAGNWHRQVSLLGEESVAHMKRYRNSSFSSIAKRTYDIPKSSPAEPCRSSSRVKYRTARVVSSERSSSIPGKDR